MPRQLTKAQIRQTCLAQRKNLDPHYITHASQKIADSIQNLCIYQEAHDLAWYFPVNGEIDLSILWEKALEKSKHCYFPAIQSDNSLCFIPYTAQTNLKLNRYNILEPYSENLAPPLPKLDIIFLPVVAFDQQCRRLGMGKGYYDKTLIRYPATQFIGVAYEWQKQAHIPSDIWDIPLDMIVTEEKIYS